MSLKSGHKIIPVIGEENRKQWEQFYGYKVGIVRFQPGGWFFTAPFIELADKIYDFKFKPRDVVIMTYPKCGTTWTQEIVWTILNNPKLNNPKAKQPVNARCSYLEFDSILKNASDRVDLPGNNFYELFVKLHPNRDPADGMYLQLTEFAEEPRIIKTHLPFSLLSPKLLDTCKVIYMARNPTDAAVSYYHHSRLLKVQDFKGTLSDFVDHLVNDTLLFSPFWSNLKEGWDRRHHPNLEYFFYEDLKADPKAQITRIANFLEANLSEKQIDDVVKYTNVDVMKVRGEKTSFTDRNHTTFNSEVKKKEGAFFRKGEGNDFKKKLSADDIKKINEWTRKNMQDFDGDFKYKTK